MTLLQSFAPTIGGLPADARPALVAVAPAAIVLAAVLLLLTAWCTVALVREIGRDGYGLERPRPISDEHPWQVAWPVRRRIRAARPWGIRRVAGAGRR